MASKANKAMCEKEKQCIAKTLTKYASMANIADPNIEALVLGYFIEGDDENMDSEGDDDLSVHDQQHQLETDSEHVLQGDADMIETEECSDLSESDSSDEDIPLVDVAPSVVERDLCDGATITVDSETLAVLKFSCKCKTKCVDTADPNRPTTSYSTSKCLRQFTVEEIVARKLEMAEFSEG